MDNKVYYGEFSLKYWIELMLRGDIELPKYQRRFVWTKEQVERMIESLKKGDFVPPVTIGSCVRNGDKCNYILDGQQRLTAVLLANIGFFPEKKKWESFDENKLEDAIEYEDNKDAITGETSDEPIDWQYPVLWCNLNSKDLESIKSACATSNKYIKFDTDLDKDFFTRTYLGFSYIVPKDAKETEQHKYYSTVFRNINFLGLSLQAEESREALYFWNTERTYWFKPTFADKIEGHTIKGKTYMDFVRYISILSQYHHVENNVNKVCYGARFSFEDYFERYIYSVAQDKEDTTFGKFIELVESDDKAKELLVNAEKAIYELGFMAKRYDTIIKMDIYFFGLLYYIIIDKKQIDMLKKDELIRNLDSQWNSYDDRHKRSPKAKKYLRKRIADSIEIYSNYLLS